MAVTWFTNPMSTTHRTRPARYYAEQIAAAYRQASALDELRAKAVELGLEYEAERLAECANEMHGEVDHLMLSALDAGYTPDDIEAAGL